MRIETCTHNIILFTVIAIMVTAMILIMALIPENIIPDLKHAVPAMALTMAIASLFLTNAAVHAHTREALLHGEVLGIQEDGSILFADTEGTFTIYGMPAEQAEYYMGQPGVKRDIIVHMRACGTWDLCGESR